MSQDKKQPEIDLERMEVGYRAGILTDREIGALHGCSHTMVGKYAKKHGWERDLTARIHARAKELVAKQMVSNEVAKERLETEKQVIEENAQAIVDIRRSHIQGIGKLQTVCDALTAELVAQSTTEDDLRCISELFALIQTKEAGEKPDPKEAQRKLDAFTKTLNLGNRAETFKKLVEAKTRLITLERTAFDLDKGAGKNQSLGEFLESLT